MSTFAASQSGNVLAKKGNIYCATIVIFDHVCTRATNTIYKAATRATGLNMCTVYNYCDIKESEEEAGQYFAKQVERYCHQRNKAERPIDDA